MKQILRNFLLGVSLLLCITFHCVAATNPVAASQDEPFFTVQLLALKNPVGVEYFQDLEGVWQIYTSEGFYKYFFKKFPDYNTAKEQATQLRTQGYSGAFVVSSQKLPASAKSPSTPQQPIPPTTPLSGQEEKATGKAISIEKFTIQLRAYKFPVYITEFEPLKDVKEFYGKDKIYRYCVGEFNTYDQAKTAVPKYQKMGYENAFVVKLGDYLGKKLE